MGNFFFRGGSGHSVSSTQLKVYTKLVNPERIEAFESNHHNNFISWDLSNFSIVHLQGFIILLTITANRQQQKGEGGDT